MAPVIPAVLLAASAGLGVYLPSPLDRDGVGLRVHGMSVRGPLLVGEVIDRVQLRITLINNSKRLVEHDPLVDADDLRTVAAIMTGPDGKPYSRIGGHFSRKPFTQRVKTMPGTFASETFPFAAFSYFIVGDPGGYRVECSMEVDKRTITSPPLRFEVVEVPEKAVLFSHPIPLRGFWAALPVNEQTRPFVQQVQIGERTLLVYRRFHGPKYGGGIEYTFRLSELRGKVELKVDGAFGDGNPLRIQYRDANSRDGWTKLVINSTNGRPWTEEDEQLRIERAKSATPPKRP